MDETTKILVGTLSGFVIAFLAEPVKLYFQRQARKNSLRRALHLELYSNYVALVRFLDVFPRKITKQELGVFERVVKYATHIEAYQYYLSHDVDLFYQLSEAVELSLLFSILVRLLTTVPAIYAAKEADANLAIDEIKIFLRRYKRALETKEFDEEFLSKLVGRDKIQSIREKDY